MSNVDAESRPRRIAVIGAGSPDETTEAQAQAVGREIARRGAVVVCGLFYGNELKHNGKQGVIKGAPLFSVSSTFFWVQ